MSYGTLADGIPLTDEDIRNIAVWEFRQADRLTTSTLEQALSSAYRSYHQEFEEEDRSRVDPRPTGLESDQKATDVSDVLEWIKPQIIRAITESPEAVRFDPVTPEDETQAEIESDYTHRYLMKHCDGYTAIYSAVTDALLLKNCVTAAYSQPFSESWVEDYKRQTLPELADLLEPDTEDTEVTLEAQTAYEEPVTDPATGAPKPDPAALQQAVAVFQQQAIQAAAMGQTPPPPPNPAQVAQDAPLMQTLYDVTIRRRKSGNRIVVSPVPLDKFKVTRNWVSCRVDDHTPFCGYESTETAGTLVAQGVPPELVDQVAPYQQSGTTDEVKRAREDIERDEPERSYYLSASQREIRVWRCYMVLDVNGDGADERIWVTLIGDSNPEMVDWYEVPGNPFATGSAIPQPHKFFGVSIYDKLRRLEEMKTNILQKLDLNLDQQNDPPKSVVEGLANWDDVSAPRQRQKVFRVREMGAVQEYPVPQIGPSAHTLLQYYDKWRMERVGVDPGMNSLSEAFPEESMNSAVERLVTAREEMVGLMIRTVTETWFSSLLVILRGLIMRCNNRRHIEKLRNQWHTLNPANWVERSSTTVRIGLGAGDRFEMRQGTAQILQLQAQAKAEGAPVPYSKRWQAVADHIRSWGRDPSDYFVDPEELKDPKSKVTQEVQMEAQQAQKAAQEAQANDPATKMAEASMQIEQLKAQVDLMKAQNDRVQNEQKISADMAQHQDQVRLELQKQLEQVRQFQEDLEFQYDQLAAKTGLEIGKVRVEKEIRERDSETSGEMTQ